MQIAKGSLIQKQVIERMVRFGGDLPPSSQPSDDLAVVFTLQKRGPGAPVQHAHGQAASWQSWWGLNLAQRRPKAPTRAPSAPSSGWVSWVDPTAHLHRRGVVSSSQGPRWPTKSKTQSNGVTAPAWTRPSPPACRTGSCSQPDPCTPRGSGTRG